MSIFYLLSNSLSLTAINLIEVLLIILNKFNKNSFYSARY